MKEGERQFKVPLVQEVVDMYSRRVDVYAL